MTESATQQRQVGVTEQQIRTWFTYHSPTGGQAEKYSALRVAGEDLALSILRNTPPGPDQTAAIRKVREAVMTANQAIACDGL